jgi:drug/metabolite transporter (DMT)-like permease
MRLQLIATSRPVAQVTRALMLTGTTGFSMAGFSLMPLAESTAFLFVTPLVVVILSHFLLRESITRGHWLAVVAGFGGALADRPARRRLEHRRHRLDVARCRLLCHLPDPDATALADREHPDHAVLHRAGRYRVDDIGGPPFTGAGPTPSLVDAALIASLGIYGGTGHLMLTRAFRYAAASFLSPFLYGQLIWAGVLGWAFYDHLPDLISIGGMLVIAGSSLSIALGERLRRRP